MRELTAYERATLELDLPVIQRWAAAHPELGAEAVVDRDEYDSNVGHVLLVVWLRDHSAVRRTREQLVEVMARPEHLRVRRWMPNPAEVERLREIVRAMRAEGPGRAQISVTGLDGETGFLVVGLDRQDADFAAEIEAVRPGWVRVLPDPIGVAPLGDDRPEPG
ncbi:hypothetical protein BWI15_22230 [Kribbella sp. ALI-6-A]|uniref:hypothetical protein n=1 Tax=Kribbella sp. ALI-6-A TaxID=1933817 RepID=UPI00097C69A7|nr:hypothetical protein [Kribbella sp. ALI-6-A]ONI69318.1 hypothetical protein BWI15_22230 [Kribbella sp. ALI-6-A]